MQQTVIDYVNHPLSSRENTCVGAVPKVTIIQNYLMFDVGLGTELRFCYGTDPVSKDALCFGAQELIT